ncbi:MULTISPECIES: hypothetical protein [Shewanella]|uniref:Lipoprotein n=1 Tax=Shewanella xiamenensis TaxID=332186 RepID=A0ABT6UJR3_9GAMM|nr:MULTISPECIES: hypothetical protein [Shewanella]MDI5833534.1 hypothetical protein [Shewanella xiamenensis]MDN5498974.1 hypothetical protein [Shewanella sp.]MDN5526899.1 hypothetical protein [Shewanella sp.]
MVKPFIIISFTLLGLASLSACVGPLNAKCDSHSPYSKQECNAADAAVYVAAAMLEEKDKSQSCADMSGKAKEDCFAQQQALRESLDKHSRK